MRFSRRKVELQNLTSARSLLQDNCSFCAQEGNRGSRPWGRQDPSSHWPLSQRELQLSGKALPPLTVHRRSDSSEAQNGSGVLPDPS